MVGRTLSHYRIIERIGAGGMGEVYRAFDERLERDVAIKVLPAGALADPAARRRFRKEGLALSRLNHPNVATIHEFASEEGIDYLVMEYIPGVTLNQRVSQGPLSEGDVLALAGQLADGLSAAHDQGLVHRDLKPGNLRVLPDGRLKILDFGLAQLAPAAPALSSAATETRFDDALVGGGTLPYMAPEQLRGDPVDHRSDVWAAGVVLYEMATGRRPFDGRLATAIAADIQTKTPAPPRSLVPALSEALNGIILKCLERAPERRYQSARALLADLQGLAATVTSIEAGSPATTSVASLARRLAVMPRASLLAASVLAAAAILGVAFAGRWRQPPDTAPLSISSIAVLPLANLSRDPGQDLLAEAMHDALISELSKISALRVISRTSTMRYKGTARPIPEIAKELRVDAVIEGTVLRSGDQLRVSATLMQGNPERQIWGDRFVRDLADVLFLTSDVARAVAGEIRATLTPVDQARLAQVRPVDPAAYEFYTVGLHQWTLRTFDGYRRAIGNFQKALAIDPGYAQAYAALADSYILLGEQGGVTQAESRAKSRDAIAKALESDPQLPDAHASLALWKLNYEWNWTEASDAYRRAVALNPGFAQAYKLHGRMLSFFGRTDEALTELFRARELDPLSPIIHAYIAQTYIFARDYTRAAEQIDRGLELNPNHVLLLHNRGELLVAQGRWYAAIDPLRQSVELSREPSTHYRAILGMAYARAGRRPEAIAILEDLVTGAANGLVSAFDLASVHIALGDEARALAALEHGYQQRDMRLVELKAWPWFDSLASEPRFRALVKGVGIPSN